MPDSEGHKSRCNENNSLVSAPRSATISLVPDSEGHKSRCNENNSLVSATRSATISLVPDSEGHKSRCNENNSLVSAPALPLSRSCQTPKVINPSVMRTTPVVLRNSLIKLFSNGPVVMVHKQLDRCVSACRLTVWGKQLFRKWG